MTDLTIIKQNGGCYINSREVAELIGKRHDHLLRDIGRYMETMEKSTAPKIGVSDFFLESSYFDSTGRILPCYLLSKMGCELVANKLTGEKGVLFTAAYVRKFNLMEAAERAELEASIAAPAPRLGEYNACARIFVRALKSIGATPESIVSFLIGIYEPFGITVADNTEIESTPQMYTAKQIAEMLGVYSITGKPHPQAVSCILNENLFMSDDHKSAVTVDYGNHIGVSIRYDGYALQSVKDWLAEYRFPYEIYGFNKTYNIRYSY